MGALGTFLAGIGKWLLQFFFASKYGEMKECNKNKDMIIEDAHEFEENRKVIEHSSDDDLNKWI